MVLLCRKNATINVHVKTRNRVKYQVWHINPWPDQNRWPSDPIPSPAHDRRSLYFTTGRPFTPQNCPFPWGIWTPSNTWFLGPTRVHNPNGISISSALFTGLTSVTNQSTKHGTPSVTIGCIYAVLPCGPKKAVPNISQGTTTKLPFYSHYTGQSALAATPS